MLSQVLHASFADTAEQRASDRRILRLDAYLATPAVSGGIRVHNLSRTGMLVECSVDIAVGSQLEVELAGDSSHPAEVVWADEGLVGCRFARPLTQAQLSAALLRSRPGGAEGVVRKESTSAQHVALARLQKQLGATQSEVNQAPVPGAALPLQQRMWWIIGLGTAAWAVPAAVAWTLIAA